MVHNPELTIKSIGCFFSDGQAEEGRGRNEGVTNRGDFTAQSTRAKGIFAKCQRISKENK